MTTLVDRPASLGEFEPATPAASATPPASARDRRGAIRPLLVWSATAILIALVSAAILFAATGGRWFIVQTPSMGTFAPVGTLVLTTPTAIEDIRVGDVVSFHPTTTPDETYTHRVVAIADDGTLRTQGDINGAVDPWATGQQDLIGEVTTAIPGGGWFAKGLPMLLAGSVLVWMLTRLIASPTNRVAMRILGLSLVASLTVFLLRPFVGLVVLEAIASDGQTDATLVSTGMLPIRVSAVGGTHVDLVSGQVGSVQVPTNGQDFYNVSSALHLPLWGWVLFGAVCALPLLYTFLIGLPAAATPPAGSRRARRAERTTS